MPTGTIIIPTTTEESEHVIEAAKQHLAEHFGGYSCYEGEGGWVDDTLGSSAERSSSGTSKVNDEGELIEENHVRLEATHNRKMRLRTELYVIAHHVKDYCNEDEVLVQFRDDETNFI
jgi:hypothetical protein